MIKIICVGKIKESYLIDGCNEYLKRLSAFDKVNLIEVKEVNNYEIRKNIFEEGKNILKEIDKLDYVITLEIEGKELDSIEFSSLITNVYNYKASNICFVIGGSNGLDEEVKKRSDYKLSFSHFTFPHMLMRLILLEQIYRAYTIINHKEYHK